MSSYHKRSVSHCENHQQTPSNPTATVLHKLDAPDIDPLLPFLLLCWHSPFITPSSRRARGGSQDVLGSSPCS